MPNIKLPKTIKMVITDFDGVVTDNCVYISDSGEISRKLNFKDVMGFSILKKQGYNTAIISGEKNSAIETIGKTFGLKEIHQDIRNKIEVLKDIISRNNLTEEEYLYIGDDVNDVECLEFSKYKITVPNAIQKVKDIDGIQITEHRGGEGAFREVADCLTD